MKKLQDKLKLYEAALKEIAEKADTEKDFEYHDAFWAKVVACKALGMKKPEENLNEE